MGQTELTPVSMREELEELRRTPATSSSRVIGRPIVWSLVDSDLAGGRRERGEEGERGGGRKGRRERGEEGERGGGRKGRRERGEEGDNKKPCNIKAAYIFDGESIVSLIHVPLHRSKYMLIHTINNLDLEYTLHHH